MQSRWIVLLFVVLTLSCGPNKEEIAQLEKLRQDSINRIIEKTKEEAVLAERERAEQERLKRIDEQRQEEMKKYPLSTIAGEWNITMKCVETACNQTSIGDVRTESWFINLERGFVSVKVIGNQNTNSQYQGTFNGKNIKLSSELVSKGFMTTTKTHSTNINMKMISENRIEGTRVIVNIEQGCQIEYEITGIKD